MDEKEVAKIVHDELGAHETHRARWHFACHVCTWVLGLVVAVLVLRIPLPEAVGGQGPILLMEFADGRWRL